MNTLIKSGQIPLLRRMMESFGNREDFFGSRLFDGDLMVPAVNIKETKSDFEIEVAAPGFEKKDFKLDIEDNVLIISAENNKETQDEKENYTRKEFSHSSFSRSFSLPEMVKEEDIKAYYENGLLHLTVQKTEQPSVTKKSIPIE